LTSKLVPLISLVLVFSGSFLPSTQSVEAKAPEAKTSGVKIAEAKIPRNSSRTDRNYFVPPPPPYTPSMISVAEGMTYAPVVTVDSDGVIVENPANPYSKYIVTRKPGGMPQVAQPSPYVGRDPIVEKKIQKHIETFDSKISNVQEDISKLLNL
jgi:hypothetical protein